MDYLNFAKAMPEEYCLKNGENSGIVSQRQEFLLPFDAGLLRFGISREKNICVFNK
jgi:hypothetical protein